MLGLLTLLTNNSFFCLFFLQRHLWHRVHFVLHVAKQRYQWLSVRTPVLLHFHETNVLCNV